MRSLHVPRHIHWVEDERRHVTLLNEHTGQWHLLNSTAAFTWRLARDDIAATDVITALSARFPGVPRERIRSDFEKIIESLALRGLISIETSSGYRNSWNETSMALDQSPSSRLGARHLIAAALALPIAIVLSRIPFRWTAWLLRFAKRHLPYPQATLEEADALARAVERVAQIHPGRMACYEKSLTLLVAAILSRRSATMHLGTATDPRRFHAWIEANGQVVRAYPDPCPGEEYQLVVVL